MTNQTPQTNENKPDKKKPSKFKAAIAIFLAFFVLFNATYFSNFIIKDAIGKPNQNARIFLVPAEHINYMYIFPLSRTFGANNFLTWPFYGIRDTLYKIGIDNIPKDDGEREYWWWQIRYWEFHSAQINRLFDIHPKDESIQELYPGHYDKNDDIRQFLNKPFWGELERYQKWDDELYSHVLSFPNAKFNDKELMKQKYAQFIKLAYDYACTSDQITNILYIREVLTYNDHLHRTDKKYFQIKGVKKEVERFENLYNTYLKYKTYAEKNEKEAIDFFNSGPKIKIMEPLLQAQVAIDLLYYLYGLNELDCSSKYFDIYADAANYMSDYYKTNKKTMDYGEVIQIEMAKGPIVYSLEIEKICKGKPAFKKYKIYIEKLRQEYNLK